ncbi:MAG: DnaD domain protein [Bacilli bacterium]|nr:DnaD domain protein [Bacilli bacterium]
MIVKILLPADTYTVINKSILDDNDKKNLISLYEPIIGPIAICLYLTLINDLDKLQIESQDFTHHHLMSLMKTDLQMIKKAREALESVGLVRTFYKDGDVASYIYELYSPLSPKEFLSHPIFNVVLYNNVGKKEYESIRNLYQRVNFSLDGYEEITKEINHTFKSSTVIPEFDIRDKEYNKVNVKDVVDFDMLSASIPKNIFNEKSLNKKMRDLINNLAYIYNLDTLKMAEIIRGTINANGYISEADLRKKTREYYTYMNNGKLPTLVYKSQPDYLKMPKGDTSNRAKMIYVFENISPYDFLKNKYKGVAPTPRDLKLLEYLLEDLKLQPAVVNVLIDYVLRKHDNKLSRAYIETIAGQWKRNKIETAEEAMQQAEKEYKKVSKQTTKSSKSVEQTPVWFKQDIKKEELTDEERLEMEELMKGFM